MVGNDPSCVHLQKKLFGVTPELLGDGRVLFDWSSKGTYLAVTGSKVREASELALDTSTLWLLSLEWCILTFSSLFSYF